MKDFYWKDNILLVQESTTGSIGAIKVAHFNKQNILFLNAEEHDEGMIKAELDLSEHTIHVSVLEFVLDDIGDDILVEYERWKEL